MSSWRISNQPTRRGLYQVLPEGTFQSKTVPATVVSAYYEMKSKHSCDDYKIWVRNFLENVDCYLVFFTDKDTMPFIESCRSKWMDRTKLITLSKSEWIANTAFPEGFWEAQVQKDPEASIHSAELYKVWYEKKEFVRRAIELNPFGHTDFVWTDAGILRSKELIPIVQKGYPDADRIPTDRMLLLNVHPFSPKDTNPLVLNGVSFGGGVNLHRIGGGVLAAPRHIWLEWTKWYDDVLHRYHQAGLFVGKDQPIMATVALEHVNKISLLDSHEHVPNEWLYLFIYLGCSPTLYQRFREWKPRRRKYTYAELQVI